MWHNVKEQFNAMMRDYPVVPESRQARDGLKARIYRIREILERISERAEMHNYDDVEAELSILQPRVDSIIDWELRSRVHVVTVLVEKGVSNRDVDLLRTAETMAREITNICSQNGWTDYREMVNGIDVALESFIASIDG